MSLKITYDSNIKTFFGRLYGFLAINLLFAGGVSFYISENISKFLFLYPGGISSLLIYIVGLNLILYTLQTSLLESNSWIETISLLALFLAIEGFLFAPFIVMYEASSIYQAAIISGSLLCLMSLFGLYTSIDLSQYSHMAFFALFAIIGLELLSIAFHFPINLQITSAGVILLFLFLISYDMQNLKNLYYQNSTQICLTRLALLGSITLFLNFVVLMVRILQLIGDKKKKD